MKNRRPELSPGGSAAPIPWWGRFPLAKCMCMVGCIYEPYHHNDCDTSRWMANQKFHSVSLSGVADCGYETSSVLPRIAGHSPEA